MYRETIDAVSAAGIKKLDSCNKKLKSYFIASILAGLFVGFGSLLIFTISGQLQDQPYTKVLMGASFGVALSLVIMAGSELFTGNNFVMGVLFLEKKARVKEIIKLWVVCYLGNFVGAAIISLFFVLAGLATTGEGLPSDATGMALQNASAIKMNADFMPLFFKGILCNILVCLAVMLGIKMKSESGKLIMIWWCLFTFITCGFEHSIANMTIFMSSLIPNHIEAVSFGGMGFNLLATTSGNIVGGLLLAIAYVATSNKKIKE